MLVSLRHAFAAILSFFLLFLLTSCDGEEEHFVASGSFEAVTVTVSSEVSGRILWWDVEEGMRVDVEDALGQVDTVQLYLQRSALLAGKAGVRASTPDGKTQTASLREQLAKLEDERARVGRLVEADAMSRKQLDDLEAQIRVLTRELSAAESKIGKSVRQIDAQSSSIDIQVAQLDDRLARCRITSPIGGVILENFVHTGELAVAGHPLFQVADLTTLYLRVYLPFYQLSHLRLGDTVRVFSDHGRGERREYVGRVSWISSDAEFTPKNIHTPDERENLVYAIRVSVANDGYLKIGMYGEIEFDAVPSSADKGVEE